MHKNMVQYSWGKTNFPHPSSPSDSHNNTPTMMMQMGCNPLHSLHKQNCCSLLTCQYLSIYHPLRTHLHLHLHLGLKLLLCRKSSLLLPFLKPVDPLHASLRNEHWKKVLLVLMMQLLLFFSPEPFSSSESSSSS
ncbi:hypothetical protein V8G54_027329 [Vigna mungo]|uniref:Uncharacterized protein n=1 Tax=Vigna mungo TaxID=3915 RepID=A0AAQ3N0I9_VIGMU